MEVFFLHEEAEEQPVEPGVEVPVEETQVVADDVIAVVGELDGLSLRLTVGRPSCVPGRSCDTSSSCSRRWRNWFEQRGR
jgi:hypothetical protein